MYMFIYFINDIFNLRLNFFVGIVDMAVFHLSHRRFNCIILYFLVMWFKISIWSEISANPDISPRPCNQNTYWDKSQNNLMHLSHWLTAQAVVAWWYTPRPLIGVSMYNTLKSNFTFFIFIYIYLYVDTEHTTSVLLY